MTTHWITAALSSDDWLAQDLARRAVVAAINWHGGNAVHAARLLRVSHRTLCRWIAEHAELRTALEAVRKAKEGEEA